MPLHRIEKLTGTAAQQERSVKPAVELELDDNQYLISMSIEPSDHRFAGYKPGGWDWVAYRGTVCG